MYLLEKPRAVDLYKGGGLDQETETEMMMDVAAVNGRAPPHHQNQNEREQQQSSGGEGEEQELCAAVSSRAGGGPGGAAGPKKRAETWVQEETRSLIGFRREVDGLFNTSKSNRHLWDQISARMREKGFDRSPTMCTDKWRNLLKEFKKARHQVKVGARSAKMSYYEDLQDLLRDRSTNSNSATANSNHNSVSAAAAAVATPPKLDSFVRFSDKGLEDSTIPFGPMEANDRSALNLERQLDHDGGDPLAITAADAVAVNGVPPWNWREGPENGELSFDDTIALPKFSL